MFVVTVVNFIKEFLWEIEFFNGKPLYTNKYLGCEASVVWRPVNSVSKAVRQGNRIKDTLGL